MQLQLKKNRYIGKLIVFEGTDGSGKTTMINNAFNYLSKKFGEKKLLLTKQPTDMSRKTKLFQKMMYSCDPNVDYRALQLLTLSDRVQHGFEEIEPALEDGKIVLCDRYIFTSIANMLARGYRDENWFFEVCRNIVKPDITFLAYVKPHLAIERIKNRPEECNRHLNEQLLYNVADEFIKLAKSQNFYKLDTSVEAKIPCAFVNKIIDEVIKI